MNRFHPGRLGRRASFGVRRLIAAPGGADLFSLRYQPSGGIWRADAFGGGYGSGDRYWIAGNLSWTSTGIYRSGRQIASHPDIFTPAGTAGIDWGIVGAGRYVDEQQRWTVQIIGTRVFDPGAPSGSLEQTIVTFRAYRSANLAQWQALGEFSVAVGSHQATGFPRDWVWQFSASGTQGACILRHRIETDSVNDPESCHDMLIVLLIQGDAASFVVQEDGESIRLRQREFYDPDFGDESGLVVVDRAFTISDIWIPPYYCVPAGECTAYHNQPIDDFLSYINETDEETELVGAIDLLESGYQQYLDDLQTQGSYVTRFPITHPFERLSDGFRIPFDFVIATEFLLEDDPPWPMMDSLTKTVTDDVIEEEDDRIVYRTTIDYVFDMFFSYYEYDPDGDIKFHEGSENYRFSGAGDHWMIRTITLEFTEYLAPEGLTGTKYYFRSFASATGKALLSVGYDGDELMVASARPIESSLSIWFTGESEAPNIDGALRINLFLNDTDTGIPLIHRRMDGGTYIEDERKIPMISAVDGTCLMENRYRAETFGPPRALHLYKSAITNDREGLEERERWDEESGEGLFPWQPEFPSQARDTVTEFVMGSNHFMNRRRTSAPYPKGGITYLDGDLLYSRRMIEGSSEELRPDYSHYLTNGNLSALTGYDDSPDEANYQPVGVS